MYSVPMAVPPHPTPAPTIKASARTDATLRASNTPFIFRVPVRPSDKLATTSPSSSLVPVRVVSEPGPGGVEIVTLAFTILASLVSILLAAWAVKVGRAAAREARIANTEASAARAAVARERARSFELEVLRDIAEVLDAIEEKHYIPALIALTPKDVDLYFGSRLAMLPDSDLPFWRSLRGNTATELVNRVPGGTPNDAQMLSEAIGRGQFRTGEPYIDRFKQRLREDVLTAINARMDARDP